MNDGWIEWVWSEEKPYPETLDTLVYVAFTDLEGRIDHDNNGLPVSFWFGSGNLSTSNWIPGGYASITHYKLAEGN